MKANPILPRILKITFAVLGALTLLVIAVVLALLWFLPAQGTYDLGDVQFVPTAGLATLVRAGGEELKINSLQGIVTLSHDHFSNGLDASVKWAMVPLILAQGGFF